MHVPCAFIFSRIYHLCFRYATVLHLSFKCSFWKTVKHDVNSDSPPYRAQMASTAFLLCVFVKYHWWGPPYGDICLVGLTRHIRPPPKNLLP